MDIIYSLLLIGFVVVSALLILVVLMQRPKQEGLGAAFGSGMTDQMFGAQTTSVLQKGTAYFGTAFLLLALVLSILISKRNYEESIAETPSPKVDASMAPDVPDVEGVGEPGDEAAADARSEALKRALEGVTSQDTAPEAPAPEAPAPEAPAPEAPAPAEPAPEAPAPEAPAPEAPAPAEPAPAEPAPAQP